MLFRYVQLDIWWPGQNLIFLRKTKRHPTVQVYSVTLLVLLYSGSRASVAPRDVVENNDCETVCEYQSEFFNADCKSRDLLKIPSTAGECRAAKYLDARFNKIGSINRYDLEQYDSIRVVQLGNNNITRIPDNMCGRSTQVIQLQLNNNQLVVIPSNAFCKHSNLRHLALDNNKIQELRDNAFGGLESLSELYLTNNNLTDLPPAVFKDLTALTKLNLGKNGIRDITATALVSLRNLRYLDLSENMVTMISKEVFKKLPNLSKLSLKGNALTSFAGTSFLSLPLLKTLDLSRNNIGTFDDIDAFLKKAIVLRHLYLQSNSLQCNCLLEPLRRWFRSNDPLEQSICVSPSNLYGTRLASHNTSLCKDEDLIDILTTSISTKQKEASNRAVKRDMDNKIVINIVVYVVLGLAVLTIISVFTFCFLFRRKLLTLSSEPPPPYKDDVYEEPADTLKSQVPPRTVTSTPGSKPPLVRQMSTGSATTSPDISMAPRDHGSGAPLVRQLSNGSATTLPDIAMTSYVRSPSKSQFSEMPDIPEIVVDKNGQAKIKSPLEEHVYQPLMSNGSDNPKEGSSPKGTKEGYIQMKIGHGHES